MAHLERFNTGNSTRRNRTLTQDGPFEIQLESESTTEKYFRGIDPEKVAEFNGKIRSWSSMVKSELVSEISRLITTDKKLSSTLKQTFYADKIKNPNDDFEIDRLGFTFKPEGVYVHLGVGRGYYRSGGQTMKRNSVANMRRKKPEKPRIAKEWFNPVLEKHMGELALIVSEYTENMILNYSRIFIQS